VYDRSSWRALLYVFPLALPPVRELMHLLLIFAKPQY
jgi:hypothetical protein